MKDAAELIEILKRANGDELAEICALLGLGTTITVAPGFIPPPMPFSQPCYPFDPYRKMTVSVPPTSRSAVWGE